MSDSPPDPPEMVACDWCGKQVPIEPGIFVESGIGVSILEIDPAERWKGERPPDGAIEADEETKQKMMDALGIDRGQLDELLEKGSVEGAACVCLECQDQALAEESG